MISRESGMRRILPLPDRRVLDGIAVSVTPQPNSAESARYFRPPALGGVEVLHASFVQHRYPEHLHDTWTIAKVDRGVATFGVHGRHYLAPEGTVFLIPPYAVHTGKSASADGYEYRVLYLDPVESEEEVGVPLPDRGDQRMPVLIRDRAFATGLDKLHNSIELPGRALEQGEILSSVASQLGGLVTEQREPLRARSDPTVARALAYVHDRWRDDFALRELANDVGLSPYHLIRTFERQIGMSPSRYRRALRVLAARRLVKAGLPPAEVAAECGFYDQSHLNRHFKAATGVTPGQYANSRT
jgi:AraC-like DNA-binding protein